MLRPMAGMILVKQCEAEEETEGGIVIPQEAQERPPEGEVISVAPDVEGVEVGDVVLYKKWGQARTVEDDDGVELIVMDPDEVLAVRG